MTYSPTDLNSLVAAILAKLADLGPMTPNELVSWATDCDPGMDEDQMVDVLHLMAEDGSVVLDAGENRWSVAA